jgi:hypothetical protein
MRTFDVYKHPGLEWQAVKVGFSWPGFFFGGIWLLCCRLWLIAVIAFASAIVVTLMFGDSINPARDLVISLTIAAVIGLFGNEWKSRNLISRGFEKTATVEAENKEMAIRLAIESPPMPKENIPEDISVQS